MSGEQPVGCIGLGKIGLPICRNLIASGREVVGYRRSSTAVFERLGGRPAASVGEVAETAGIVLTCVDNDAAMAEVVAGLVPATRPGQVVVCLSSHPVAVKRHFAEMLAEREVVLIDGEVSGTPSMIEARRAAVYLAGPEDAARLAEPVVRGFVDMSFYLGTFGSATLVKLVNNFLVAFHIAGAAQAIALGQALDLDPALMIPAIVHGSGASVQFAIRAPWMAEGRFTPRQGAASVLLRYLKTIQNEVDASRVSLALLDQLVALYRQASQDEGDRDVAALVTAFQRHIPNSKIENKL